MNNEAILWKLREKLTEKRYHHSICVAEAAEVLAKRFGADGSKAYRAGLLHDIMKDTPRPEQLKIIEESDILLNTVELHEPKLLHAIAGAAYIRSRLGIDDDEIIDAVRYHTTARAGMKLLEKILYIADFISEDRNFEGVDMIRKEVEKGLDRAMLVCTRFTVEELIEKNLPIHTDSVEAYNECAIKLQDQTEHIPPRI